METYKHVFPFDIVAARLGLAPEAIVKLDANENPYGTSPRVRAAVAKLAYIHIYPDSDSHYLRGALAEFTGLPAENLLAGAGADEMIDLIMRTFLGPGDAILQCPPTFGMYSFDAVIAGARVASALRRPDFALNLETIEEAVRQHNPKLLFVTSPNNPDGGWLPDTDLQRLLKLPVMLIVDEAYVEFAGAGVSRISWVPQHDNLIVLRTFSKWAGLAGLRVGYGAFPRWLVPHMRKIKQPYTVSMAASAAAMAALEDRAYLEQLVARIVEERERLWRLLVEIPYLKPYPSRANFVLCRVVGRDARQLKEYLEKQGILVRYFEKPGLTDHIRISVGRSQDTDALLSALRRL
ncbi:MAG: histidinol-phosphate transaminase [Chloroflexi bacterium]|nr:histidinol-phosphate transaminase [Chloroflexota bacterium]